MLFHVVFRVTSNHHAPPSPPRKTPLETLILFNLSLTAQEIPLPLIGIFRNSQTKENYFLNSQSVHSNSVRYFQEFPNEGKLFSKLT